MVFRIKTIKAILLTGMTVATLLSFLLIQNHLNVIRISRSPLVNKEFSLPMAPTNASTEAPPAKKKYLIYYCDKLTRCLGWGDRQRGIMSAYVLAMATNRTFGIIMTKPCLLTKFFQPNKVQWDIDASEFQHKSAQYFDLISNDMFSKALTATNLDALFHADVIYVVTNRWYINPLLRNNRYKKKLKSLSKMTWRSSFSKVMKAMFKHSSYMDEKIAEMLNKTFPSPAHKLVCAQIRLGTNPTIPLDFRVRNSLSSIGAVWKFLRKYNNSDVHKIFVTTDSQKVRKNARTMFASQIVDIEGAIVHVDSYEPGRDEFACGGFEKALLDQHLLSLCDVLVVSRGGFGFNAIYVRQKRGGVYIFHKGKVEPLDCNRSPLCY